MSDPFINLARAELLLEQGVLPETLADFHRAEQLGADPDRCSAGRWTIFTQQGDLAATWRESDAIRYRSVLDPNSFWQEEDFDGKRIILRCLHGMGAAVQFLLYVPILRARCACLVVEGPPRTVELVHCLSDIDEVISWEDKAPEIPPVWDLEIKLIELPYLFRATLADLPVATRYLHLPEAELYHATSAHGPCSLPRIGVVWTSGEWNLARGVPFELLMPLLSRTDCQFWNLPGERGRTCWHPLPHRPHRCDTALIDDVGLVPLATVIAELDLVITADTLAGHLAGALDVPCWLLLQYVAEWCWMVRRSDSPWYPSLRLFRQPALGDWPGLVAHLYREFKTSIMGRSCRGAVA